ncbi:MAG TPA: nitrogen fixation protein NifH [Spirochaetia bacterium]|nr:nitrogen fixation protein NifH [Spirochaetia bacterium]
MDDWKSLLEKDPTDWLLEPANPSVRYLTLTALLGEPESGRRAGQARREIMRTGIVPEILAKQHEGRWNEAPRFYRDKYSGTAWQLIILAEHMADPDHPQIRGACEYILSWSQETEHRGFSYDGTSASGGQASGVIPCLTGNMVFSLIRLGYLDDDRVQRGVEWIARYQRFDDGAEQAPSGPPYDRYEMCWGTHSCHMGVVKALKGLAEIPIDHRSPEVGQTISKACEYLLAHHLFKRSHDLTRISRPGWLKLQFPLMYQTDILEIANLLAGLGYRDDRMQEAVEKILAKQTKEGRWALENSFNGRFQVDVETKGKPSKWITLNVLRLLKDYCA